MGTPDVIKVFLSEHQTEKDWEEKLTVSFIRSYSREAGEPVFITTSVGWLSSVYPEVYPITKTSFCIIFKSSKTETSVVGHVIPCGQSPIEK